MGLDDKKVWKIDKPVGIQSKQERQAINQARRRDQFIGKVSREARRNKDLKGYLEAERAGYTNRGIENVDDKNARFRESANQRRFYGDAAVGSGQPPTGGSQPPNVGTPPTTGTQTPSRLDDSITPRLDAQRAAGGTPPTAGTPPVPAPTAGFPVGSGSEIGTAQPATPAMSAAEQSKQATLEKTLAGNFGKVAQARAQAKQSGGTYDATPSFDTRTEGRKAFVDVVGTLNKKEGGITPKEVEQAKARGAALGLTPQQIQDTLDGQNDLSPEAIAGRAKARKDEASAATAAAAKEAYDKEFKASDDYIEKAIAGLGPKFTDEDKAAIRKNMAGLKPEQRKEAADKSISDTEKGNAETTRKTKEFKDLLPAAKEALQGLIDVQDKYGYDSSNLKKLRGAPALSKEQKAIMDEGGFITNRGGVELDPVIPSGNPLFDNPNAESVAWARGSVTPKTPSKEDEKKPNNELPKNDVIRPDRVWGDSLIGDANKVADLISKPLDAVSFQRVEAALDSSRRREGNRAMNFADIIGGYLTGKKNKIVKTIKEPPQASINIGKIQGSYEKASRGADDILFGLSFDQRKV